MNRSHRAIHVFTLLWLTVYASAQAKPQLTLATVLERGPALAASSPTVLWFPDGHDGTVVLTQADGMQAMHRLQKDQPEAEPWFVPRDVLAALPSTKEASGAAKDGDDPATAAPAKRFPPMSWHAANTLRIQLGPAIYHWQVGSEKAQRVLSWMDADTTLLEVSPTDRHAAVRKHHQLFLHEQNGSRHQLTFDGSEDIVIADAAHRAEIGITKGTFWRDDGRFLAFYREDQRPILEYPYQDLKAMPPRKSHGRYPMAGRPHSVVQVKVCDTTTYQIATLEGDADEDLYWTNVTFGPNDTVLVTLVNRGQDHLELASFDAVTGKRLATLLREHDAEWIEPEHPPQFLPDGTFLWWSSRSGYRHIYLHDHTGKQLRQVTNGNFDVQSLLDVDQGNRQLWFEASGDDARQLHLFSANLDELHQQQITKERGTHQLSLSPDAARAFDLWSNLETPPTPRICDTKSGAITVLQQGPDPLAAFALPKQQFFAVTAEDGTTLYGHVAIPNDLKPGERAPVIHYVYGGPHAQLVKDQWLGGAATWLQGLAGEGFVICRLDNRGTPNRGIEFEQKVHRHLGTLEVADQLLAIDWLKRQSFVDGSRIGVHGWSFGGYMTLRLMLLHPEVFACGISGAPVTDWAMYETGYGERYMDSPQENPDGYEASSCLPIAGRLQRPLLVVHGTDDRTVMWSHTLKFVDACVAAQVDLDYFPYPQQLHGLRGVYRKHFLLKLEGFFRRYLRPEERGAGK